MISRPARVFVLACLVVAAAVTVALLLQGVYDSSRTPGGYCTVVYSDGSTGPGQVAPGGQCRPLHP